MKKSVTIFFILVMSVVNCFALEKSERGWVYPMNRKPSDTEWKSWKSYAYHVGHDYMQSAEMPVRAIADGVIIDYGDALAYFGSAFGDVGGAILVRHKTSDNQEFYAVYGHNYRNPDLKRGYKVNAGDVIAVTHPYIGKDGTRQDHIHFGIHPYAEPLGKNRFRGVADSSGDYGWVNPKEFLETHTPLNNNNPTRQIQYVGNIGWYPSHVSCINAQEWYHVTREDGKVKILPMTKLACWNVRYQEYGVGFDVVFGSGPLTCHK